MQRIWFRSDTIERNAEFEAYMAEYKVDVIYGTNAVGKVEVICGAENDGKKKVIYDADVSEKMEDILIIVDNPKIFAKNPKALVYIQNESEMNDFPNADYFVMDVFDAEYDYFLKIWQRQNNIPWTIAETDRLIVRETTEEDLPGLIEIYSDPDVTKYTEELFEEPCDELNYIREYRKKVYGIQGFGIWSVIRKEDCRLIGRAGLVARPAYEGVETGFVFGKEYWGKGYASEAVKVCIDMAEKMEFTCVRALTMTENAASRKLLTKLDFCMKGHEESNGQIYEVWEISFK